MRRWPSVGSWPASTKSLIRGISASKECRRWSAIIARSAMHLDLTDEETRALLNHLVETIEADRYPMSPRIRALRAILVKFGGVGGLSPEMAAWLRRYAPPPPARPPTPEDRDPSRRPRQGRRSR